MSSNCLKVSVVILLTASLVFGCASEDQAFVEKAKFSFGKIGGQCLSQFGKNLDDFIESKISEQKLAHFWDCTYSSLQMFADFVSGQNPGYYTQEEIKTFLETYFLKDNENFNLELVSALMGLKRIFIGGVEDRLTKSEIRQSRHILGVLKQASIKALPYMSLYTFNGVIQKEGKEFTDQEVDEAVDLLEELANDLSATLMRVNQDYSFQQFQDFLDILEKDMDPKNPDEKNTFSKFIPVAAAVKSILVSKAPEDDPYVRGHEWREFFKQVFKSYGMAIRGFYYLGQKTWFTGVGLEQLNKMVHTIFQLLNDGVDNNSGEIPNEKVDRLFVETEKFTEIPLGLTSGDLQSIWRNFVQKILRPIPFTRDEMGFDEVALSTLNYEYDRWFEAQNYVNEISFLSHSLRTVSSDNHDTFTATQEIFRVLNSPIKMILDDANRVLLQNVDNSEFEYDRFSLSTMNWQKTIIRMFIRAYTTDQIRREDVAYLTSDEMKQLFYDFADLAFALTLIKKGETEEESLANINRFVDNAFVEGNLFLPSASGDVTISLEEGVQYLIFALSALNSSNKFFDQTAASCEKDENCELERDEKNNIKGISADFVRSAIKSRPEDYISHMPQMLEYFESLPEDGKTGFMRYLEASAGALDKESKFAEVGGLTKLCVLMEYIEALLVRFDSDRSGHLTFSEAATAFPIFQELLIEFSSDIDSRKRAEAIYYYLIRYGKIPESIWDKIRFVLFWEKQPKKWRKGSANRYKIARIIAVIKSEINKNSRSILPSESVYRLNPNLLKNKYAHEAPLSHFEF